MSAVCLSLMQTLTVTELLAYLIVQDDAAVTSQLLSVLRRFSAIRVASDAKFKAAAATVANTIKSFVNNDDDAGDDGVEDQVNVDSVVLVAAAKHGSPHVVQCAIDNHNSTIPGNFAVKAMNEAQTNNHVSIVECISQRIAGCCADRHPTGCTRSDSNKQASITDVSAAAPQHLNHPSIGVSSCKPEKATVETLANSEAAIIQQYEKDMNAAHDSDDKRFIRVLSLVDPHLKSSAVGTAAALWCASYNDDSKWLKTILADPLVNPAANENGAIQLACLAGNIDILKLLLSDSRVNPGAADSLVIQLGCQNGHLEIVRMLLLDPRVDPSANDNFAFGLACYYGHTEVARLMLSDLRVHASAGNDYAMRMACQGGHYQTVKLLLSDPRINPAADDNVAIRQASLFGHTGTVQLLMMDDRVDPTADGNFALREASNHGHSETMRVLLQNPRVNLTTEHRYGCVELAIERGFVDVVSVLLARFPQLKTNLLQWNELSAERGHYKIFTIILQYAKAHLANDGISMFIRRSIKNAHKHGRHQFVLELLTQPIESAIGKAVVDVLYSNYVDYDDDEDVLYAQLACMHPDVLRLLQRKYKLSIADNAKNSLMRTIFQTGSLDVVQELLDNYQDKCRNWTVDDFNAAALHGNIPVLRLLNSTQYGGFKKLTETLPLNCICTREVLTDMRVKSSIVLVWCMKKKTTSKIMAKLLDVVRNLVSDKLLCWEMK